MKIWKRLIFNIHIMTDFMNIDWETVRIFLHKGLVNEEKNCTKMITKRPHMIKRKEGKYMLWHYGAVNSRSWTDRKTHHVWQNRGFPIQPWNKASIHALEDLSSSLSRNKKLEWFLQVKTEGHFYLF